MLFEGVALESDIVSHSPRAEPISSPRGNAAVVSSAQLSVVQASKPAGSKACATLGT